MEEVRICMLLPERSQGSTLKTHMLFIGVAPLLQAKQTQLALST